MLVYWVLFAYFSVGALLERPNTTARSYPALWFGALLIALLIGLRFQVGADWQPYVWMFNHAGQISLLHAATLNDPAYSVLNWTVRELGGDLWWVNTICSSIFSFGLLRFAVVQERPWLTILVAIPYLVIVVAMGYTRQAVAIGIILAGLASFLENRSVLRLALYFLLASLFHKTALLAFPLVCLSTGRYQFLKSLFVVGITYVMFNTLLSNSVDALIKNYIHSAYSSQGAAIRVSMIIVPALVFFANKNNLELTNHARGVWLNFSITALGLLMLLWVLPSSTVVDRLALFVIPLQLAVLPRAWKGRLTERVGVAIVMSYSALVQFAWLNFAVHARFWVPYRFWPFE